MHFVITVFRMFCLHVEHFKTLRINHIRIWSLKAQRDLRTMHLSTSSFNSASFTFELCGLLDAICLAFAASFSASFFFLRRDSSIFCTSWRLRLRD